MTMAIKIGAPGGDGPYLCDYGMMRISGNTTKISFWDGWPQTELQFDHTDEEACAQALALCRAMQATVEAQQAASEAAWLAKPWWQKIARKSPRRARGP